MRTSFAWKALPDNARRVLDLLEIVHMQHGGAENGKLVCTYDQFKVAGLRRASISRAIRQCVALGFLEITKKGYRRYGAYNQPSYYRLTYVLGQKHSLAPCPTHEWRAITSQQRATDELGRATQNTIVESTVVVEIPEPASEPMLGANSGLRSGSQTASGIVVRSPISAAKAS